MKKKYFHIIITLISFASLATAQVTFIKNYGSNYEDYGTKVIQKNNGDYFITGYTDGFGAGGNIYLMDMDNQGHVRWVKDFFGVSTDIPHDMISNLDGGFSIVGMTQSFGTGHEDGILITTDSLANIERTITFGTAIADDELNCILKINNGFILGGAILSGSVTNGSLIYKTDTLGNIIWSSLLAPYQFEEIINSIYQCNDSGFIILRTTLPFYTYYFSIIKLDKNGNCIWAKNYSTNNPNLKMCANKMKQTSDNGFIITGYTDLNAVGADMDIFLLKTDSVGNKLWCKTFGDTFEETGEDVIQTSDGGYIVAGNTNSYGFGGYDAILLKTDSAGKFNWANTYGNIWDDFASSVIQSLDGGYALVGYTNLSGINIDSLDILFIKTDSLGNSQCNTSWNPISQDGVLFFSTPTYTDTAYGITTFPNVVSNLRNFPERNFCSFLGIEEVKDNNQFNIYPNPFNDKLNISVLDNEQSQIILYDILSRKLLQQEFTNSISLNTSQLASGIYIYELRNKNGTFNEGKIIKE